MFDKKGTLSLALCLALLGALGCGGATDRPLSGDAGKGAVELTITWPEPSRYIPPYAKSLYFELYRADAPNIRYNLVANRPEGGGDQTVRFGQLLAAGSYTLAGVARVEKDGLGATVASAVTSVAVEANKTASAALTLVSTVNSIQILGEPLKVMMGQTRNLHGRALDPDGKVVFLPGGALTWSLVSGGEFASLNPDGKVSSINLGTARVRLTEVGAGVSYESNVQVVPASGTGLADSAWPKFRGNPRGTGLGVSTNQTMTKLWEFSGGSPGVVNLSGLTSSPSIGVDGTIYIGSLDGNVYALDGYTGAKLWQFTTGGAVLSSPAIGADGTVYIGSTDSKVYALDGGTGIKIWEFLTGDQVNSSPAIGTNGTVYIASQDSKLYALDGENGTKLWEFLTGGFGFSASPALGATGTVYFGSDSKVYALDGSNGALVWEHDLVTSTVASSPSVASNGTVYIGTGGSIVSLNGATGAKNWDYAITGSAISCPAIGSDGTVFGASATNGDIFAIDGTTGAEKWLLNFGNRVTSSPAVSANGTVYIGSLDGHLYALDTAIGEMRWRLYVVDPLNPDSGVDGSPAIGSDGTIYFSIGNENKVFALR